MRSSEKGVKLEWRNRGMEYFRDPNNQIQADFAYRLGMIAIQYRTLATPALKDRKKDMSVTLDVCILQNLLTTCMELKDSMEKYERQTRYLTAVIGPSPVWGLRQGMIEVDTFAGKRTVGAVLKRLRNALSHPTALDINHDFPSTGFTTIPDGSEIIHQYCFVASPDIESNGRLKHYSQEEAERELKKAKRDMPDDVRIIRNDKGKFCFGQGDKHFARIFKINLTCEEIHALVIGLSNYLAQPIQENWDGHTVARLVA